MTPLRHPGAPRLIEWTGERCVPWTDDAAIVYEHFHRYLWAASMLEGRTVLDLGSGEGFGAAILARRAAAVTGVDVDERAVEHARSSYERDNLRFEPGSALDLSGFAAESFDAVVAFEMIEHVEDHERLMAEIGRVLSGDGMLLVSTPDKDLYSEAAGQENAFHEHELTLDEFEQLLRSRFEHVAMWGQRTIAGSLLSGIERRDGRSPGERGDGLFFIAPADGGWEPGEEPAPLFCVAVASRGVIAGAGRPSTLADPTLELRREALRSGDASVAERDRLLAEANSALTEQREEALALAVKVQELEAQLLAQGDELWATRVELDTAQQFERRVQESVSWQALQRARSWLYGAIGEDSRAGRALSAALRRLGRR